MEGLVSDDGWILSFLSELGMVGFRLESAKQEGASNRFMMGPPEGQDITLEMANRALANGCKQRDEEITKLKVGGDGYCWLQRYVVMMWFVRTRLSGELSDSFRPSWRELLMSSTSCGLKRGCRGPIRRWQRVMMTVI